MGCDSKDEPLHIISFNIRYDNPNDGINRWDARIPVVESYLTSKKPDIVGMQEVVHRQLLDLQDMLVDYAYVGTGREDGKTAGEYSPIFYKKDKLNLIDHSQFDHIFVNDHFEVDTYQVDRIVDGEVFISGHWPVVSKISFKNQ